LIISPTRARTGDIDIAIKYLSDSALDRLDSSLKEMYAHLDILNTLKPSTCGGVTLYRILSRLEVVERERKLRKMYAVYKALSVPVMPRW
jgi:hypothetical protein